ncbi:hypothetical protein ADL22_32545 [Streptomyces sp. NRRL F-4489]|uniref:hypothetical protein n=1 Tax=Streptomyces sp. NRRL F-4489 TaxID=1609095 RepID=UPI000747F8AF|nr:hypothetical protein [Streptomyces sp. NRRL F-4489]KUL33637.1 hypothetical protein ADL22_32545 [Streptomyces sp. NRRL F-4489]
MRGIVGFFVMLQGALGLIGLFFFDGPWGVLRHWFDLPWPAYLGVFAAGLALMAWGEHDRGRKKPEGAGGAG